MKNKYNNKDWSSKRDYLYQLAKNTEIEKILETVADDIYIKMYSRTTDIDHTQSKIWKLLGFNDPIVLEKLITKYLIEGCLSIEIIYNKNVTNIIGFKELDPISIQPSTEKSKDGIVNIWWQYKDSSELKRKLYDAEVVFIKYPSLTQQSFVERLVRPFNLLHSLENTAVTSNMMSNCQRTQFDTPVGIKSPTKVKESLSELTLLHKEEISLDDSSGELLVNGKHDTPIYKNYYTPSHGVEHMKIKSIGKPTIVDIQLLNYFKAKFNEAMYERNSPQYHAFIRKQVYVLEELINKPMKLINKLKLF